MSVRKRKTSKSFLVVKQGVETKRPAPPGQPESNQAQTVNSNGQGATEGSSEA